MIDAVVLYFLWAILFTIISQAQTSIPAPGLVMASSLFFIAFLYMVMLKRSPVRTLGYLAMKIKVVALQGGPPSLSQMVFRSSLLMLGPMFMFIDLFLLFGDARRRKLSDLLAGTCVVRSRARPSEHSAIVLGVLFVLGYTLFHWDVKSPVERLA